MSVRPCRSAPRRAAAPAASPASLRGPAGEAAGLAAASDDGPTGRRADGPMVSGEST